MPRKEREAQPTRGEKLPPANVFLEQLPRNYSAPIGAWAVDDPITKMHEKGLCRRYEELGLKSAPHPLLRQELMDAAFNSYVLARSVYSYRDGRSGRGRRKDVISALLDATEDFLAEFRPEGGEKVRVAEKLQSLLTAGSFDVAGAVSDHPLMPGPTADFLKLGFVSSMPRFWWSMTGQQPARPHKTLFVELAVATWIDARLPGYEADPARLHARIKKWFDPKKENCPTN
jgi:hypothetical protein